MQIPVTRLMVELAVGKGLKECARGNLPRLLQLLIGNEDALASAGCPPELEPLARRLFRDAQHPYAVLAQKAVEEIDRPYFMGFLINLGYESAVRSGETLRAANQRAACRLPWMLGLQLPFAHPDVLRKPISMGVQSYLLFVSDAAAASGLRALCRAYPHAAFSALIPDRCISEDLLRELKGTDNLAILPVCRGLHFASAPVLMHSRRLYCPVCLIDRHDAEQMLTQGDFALPEHPACLFSAFVPGPDIPAETADALATLLFRLRMEPQRPAVPFFPSADLLNVHGLITGERPGDFSLPGDADFSPFLLPGEDMLRLLETMA